MGATAAFVKDFHGARTKLYDDCLYAAYHLPLLPGRGGYRIRSSPVLKSAGGRAVLDEEIERNERRGYHEEYLAEEEEHSVGVRGGDQHAETGHEHGDQSREDEVVEEPDKYDRHHEDEGQRNGSRSDHANVK